MTSIFQRVFGKLEEQKVAKQEQLAKNYEGLCRAIADQVQGRMADDEEALAAFIEDTIHVGVASPEQIRKLTQAAESLHAYIQASEVPRVDEEAVVAKFQEIRDRCNAEIKAAAQAVHQAREANGQKQAARKRALRLVNEFPELSSMFSGCSWKPRIEPTSKTAIGGAPVTIEVDQDAPIGGGGSVTFRDDAPAKSPKVPK